MKSTAARAAGIAFESPGPAAVPAKEPIRRASRSGRLDALALAVVLAIPAIVTIAGAQYYALGRAGRLRHVLHPWLKPSGPVGLSMGIAGLAMFLFMWLYPLRKRFRWLSWTGGVATWLRIHVVVGLALPVVAAVHAGWRFDGLIGLGYLAMFIVCLSGIAGRYLYVRIPRSRQGVELGMDEVARERRSLVTRIAAATGLEPGAVEQALAVDVEPYAGLGPLRTVLRLVRDDFARWRALSQIKRAWRRPRPGAEPLDPRALREVMRLARREISLAQQGRVLDATRRVFAYWHVAHRPFALTALVAVLVHVVVAIVVGGVGAGFAGH